jgi:CRISPR-associated RAMP protein, Csm3 family
MSLKLEKYIEFKGALVCKTGLRIGGSKDDIEIGGLDNPIIRDPVTRLPYIPGSSLKGKLRSSLEYKYGKVGRDGSPCGCAQADCPVCKLFGPHIGGLPREDRREAEKRRQNLGPTRIIVRDIFLTDESKKELEVKLESGSQYTEIKQEVSIDRRTSTASGAGPRPMERIPAGTKFASHIALRIFEGDDKDGLIKFVKEGLT